MNTLHEHRQAALATIDRSHPGLVGTWTIDPSDSGVSFAWRTPRLGTTTGRLRCWGVVHLDGLPPVGVIQFEQPSGLPVLTLAHLDVDPGASGPDRLVLRGRGVLDRRAGVGKRASILGGRIQLHLAVRARRVVQLLPRDAVRRVDAPAPNNCPA
jgi:hypothetical protein